MLVELLHFSGVTYCDERERNSGNKFITICFYIGYIFFLRSTDSDDRESDFIFAYDPKEKGHQNTWQIFDALSKTYNTLCDDVYFNILTLTWYLFDAASKKLCLIFTK
jgi:hypothetical protein